MFLKKVEMRGFKTFADRTELEFGPGITAIVGPNGVGKSNVSDSILWALGEQSNRALRTQASQDIIFAGSEKRRPIGMAEVAVTIDNTDSRLPVDFAEIVVARRLFRSGDSEYLLNRSAARLRDIRDMLLDTGVGPDAYSVIGQGEIDAILSIRSEDRRELLEEVAGIRKYRVRRDEATRKLEATQANMTRVKDILAELRSQRVPLEQEANTARQFQELSERLKELELYLLAGDYNRRRNRIGKLANELEITKADLQGTRNKVSELEAEYERSQLDLAKLSDEVDALRDRATAAERELDQARQAQALLEERLQSASSRQRDLALTVEGRRRRAVELGEQLEQVRGEYERTCALREEAEKSRDSLEAELREKTDAYRLKAEAIRKLETEQAELLKNASALENEALAMRSLETDLAERSERLSRQSENLARRELEVNEALAGAKARCEELAVTLERGTASLQELRDSLARANRALQEHRQKCNLFAGAVSAREAQEELLRQLERSREGFGDGVKAVLQAAEAGRLEGVHGIVADLIDVPARFERAVEAALMDVLQWVVVDADEQAAAGAELVLKDGLGRVTFLPLAGALPHQPIVADAVTGQGCLGPAMKNVRVRREYQKLFERLLEDTHIVRDLPTALDVRQRSRGKIRLVTLDGVIVHADGPITVGGEEGAGAQAFVRRRELEALAAELGVLRSHLAAMWEREEHLEQWSAKLAEQVHDIESELSRTKSQQATSETEVLHLTGQQKATREASLELSEEAETLNDRLSDARTRRESAEARCEHLRGQAEEVGERIAAARAEGIGLAEVDSCRARHVNAQVAAAELTEKQRSLQSMRDRYTSELNRAQTEAQAAEQELSRAEETEAALRRELETPAANLTQLEQTAGVARGAVREGAEALSVLRERVAALDGSRTRLGHVAEEQIDLIHRTELAIAREEAQVDIIVQRLDDAYGMTPGEAFDARDDEASERAVRDETRELREKIRALGPVNISAIDECERLRAREDFLDGQLTDLEAAKNDLLQVIAEIDEIATREFLSTLERMQEQFRAMFTRLFGGGQTELRLTDEENPLQSGLDVIVQVPGKRQQNLLLLSGGERALTAMALIFAMLKVRPSPFCLMDEIDAALDEANVGRFVDVLKDFAQESQFIIVTHNPNTIQAADVLFGITMEDAGVSRVIKLELREWEGFLADAEERVASVRAPRAGSRVLPSRQ